jgi:hypothetical protein
MSNKRETITDPDLAKVGVALKRAAAKARQLGFDTNTPVYVFRDGKIVDIVAEHRAKRSPKMTRVKSSQKKTTSPRRKAQSRKSIKSPFE